MVALRRAAGDSCRRVAAFLQANVAAAVLQVVLVTAALDASDSTRGIGFTVLRLPAPYPQGCSYGRAIDAKMRCTCAPICLAFLPGQIARVPC